MQRFLPGFFANRAAPVLRISRGVAFGIALLGGASAHASTLASGTYEFAFTATLAQEVFESETGALPCSGIYAASDECLSGQVDAGTAAHFSTSQGFDALDAAGIGSPADSFRNASRMGSLTIEFDGEESGQWLDPWDANSSVTCRIDNYICGGSSYGRFFLQMGMDADGELILDISYYSWSWSGWFSPDEYTAFYDADVVNGLSVRGYLSTLSLSDFELVSGPEQQIPHAPLPASLAFLATALSIPLLRRRR